MAYCQRNSVRRVVGFRGSGEIENALDHVYDLIFLRSSVADDSLLDLKWCVLINLYSELICRKKYYASCMGNGNTCCDVCVEMKRNGNSGKSSDSCEDSVNIILDAINDAGGSLPIAKFNELPLTSHQLEKALEKLRSEGRLIIKGAKVALV